MHDAQRTAIVYPEDIASEDELKSGVTNDIKIDFSAIPGHVREDLAAATFECVRSFLQQPGGREFLEAKKLAKKKTALKAEN